MNGERILKVSDIKTPVKGFLKPGDTLTYAAQKMSELGMRGLPVCRGDRLVGWLSEHDIVTRCAAEGLDPRLLKVEQFMTPDPEVCLEDQNAYECRDLMDRNQLFHLPVVDNDLRLVGMVSRLDGRSRGRLGNSSVKTSSDASFNAVLVAGHS